MLMTEVTEIVFDAYDHDGRIVNVTLVLSGYHEDAGAADQCRAVIAESDSLEEFLMILRVVHIQVPKSMALTLPLLDCSYSDIESTWI